MSEIVKLEELLKEGYKCLGINEKIPTYPEADIKAILSLVKGTDTQNISIFRIDKIKANNLLKYYGQDLQILMK